MKIENERTLVANAHDVNQKERKKWVKDTHQSKRYVWEA